MTLLTTWPSATDDDGTGQTGTIEDAAFFTSMKTAIETLIHSTTNTTTTPEDIIDEVVTARGSKSTLDGRLDISLNEDGTPKASAFTGYVATADLQAAQGMRNLVLNDDLTDWANGAAAAPDQWTLSGGGAAVARTGSGEADTFSFLAGKYSAKITYGAAAAKLTQIIKSTTDFAFYTRVQGKTIAFGCWGKSSISNHLSIVLDDGVTTTRGGTSGNATYHTGGGSAEWMYGTHTIANTATKIDVYVEVASAGSAYAGGFGVLFSNKALLNWPQFSAVQVASETAPGLVSIIAQSFAGQKTFRLQPQAYVGTATTQPVTMGGVFFVDVTPHNVIAGQTDSVMTNTTIPANMLNANGKAIALRFGSSIATTGANTKTYELDIGGTQVVIRSGTSNSVASQVSSVMIIRIDSDTVEVAVQTFGDTTLTQGVTIINSLDFTAALALRTLGTTGAGSTMDQTFFIASVI